MSGPQIELDRSDVILRAADGAIVAAIPQFGLFAQGSTVQVALAALEEKKSALQAEFAAFSALRDMSAAQEVSQSVRWGEIKQFAIKVAIVFILIMGTLMYSAIKMQELAQSAIYHVQSAVQDAVRPDTEAFWRNLERELDAAAAPGSDLPPEKKQKLLSDIRIIAERWRPFVAEASAIFTPPSPPTAKPTEPK